jgi:hypothetical protein
MLVYLSLRRTGRAHEHENFKSFGLCLWVKANVLNFSYTSFISNSFIPTLLNFVYLEKNVYL